jgi:RNA polymerase sigma factor (TIGR02999 family)
MIIGGTGKWRQADGKFHAGPGDWYCVGMSPERPEPEGAITRLLEGVKKGDPTAIADLFPLVYDELRRVAGRQIRREYGPRTIGATALVHEAYIKLLPAELDAKDRGHFVAVAARAMRQILIDRARQRLAEKRGGDARPVTLTDEVLDGLERPGGHAPVDVIALDDALSRLAALDPEAAEVVELRFFGGLTIGEVATMRGTSPATVKRHWAFAQSWLRRALA